MFNDNTDLYILDKHGHIQKVDDWMLWAEWSRNLDNKRIAHTTVADVSISTVFLAMDIVHSWERENHVPKLFETIIIGGERDGETHLWETKNEALTGHDEITVVLRHKYSRKFS